MDDKELKKAWLRRKFSSFEYHEEMLSYHEQVLSILEKYWNRDEVRQHYPSEWKTMQQTVLPNLKMIAKPGQVDASSWRPGISTGWARAISYNFNRGISDLYFDESVCIPTEDAKLYGSVVNKVLRMCKNIEYTADNTWYDDEDGNDDSILEERFTGPVTLPANWREEILATLGISPILPTGSNARCDAAQPCPRSGFWWTPAKQGSRRYFNQGDVMPDFPNSQFGETIWYWDQNQG